MANTETSVGNGAEGHAEAAVGMPQLDFATFPNQIFWLLVTLIAIYLILSQFALPRIATTLSARHGKIANDIAMAEEMKRKAEEAETAYEETLEKARNEARRIVGEAKTEIDADLEEATARADAEIAAKTAESERVIAEIRAGAAESTREVAQDTAKEIVTALGHSVAARDIAAAVDARMEGRGR